MELDKKTVAKMIHPPDYACRLKAPSELKRFTTQQKGRREAGLFAIQMLRSVARSVLLEISIWG
jgi:hypothetical protein